ncbi:hypothetical protein, partial [Lactococcus lactis]|uniref:hypothetical protein n=1 Tax=Lactococcus lactis TaxID=1358 RepID=UPI000B061714
FFINTPKAPTNLGVFLSSRLQVLLLQKVNKIFLEALSSIQSILEVEIQSDTQNINNKKA